MDDAESPPNTWKTWVSKKSFQNLKAQKNELRRKYINLPFGSYSFSKYVNLQVTCS